MIVEGVRFRIRLWIANLWDRLFPQSCWAESAAWAMRVEDCRLRLVADDDGVHPPCYTAARAKGYCACWCGKFVSRSAPAVAERGSGC